MFEPARVQGLAEKTAKSRRRHEHGEEIAYWRLLRCKLVASSADPLGTSERQRASHANGAQLGYALFTGAKLRE